MRRLSDRAGRVLAEDAGAPEEPIAARWPVAGGPLASLGLTLERGGAQPAAQPPAAGAGGGRRGGHRPGAERHPELAARTVIVTGGAFTAEARAFLDGAGLPVPAKPFSNGALLAALARAADRPA